LPEPGKNFTPYRLPGFPGRQLLKLLIDFTLLVLSGWLMLSEAAQLHSKRLLLSARYAD